MAKAPKYPRKLRQKLEKIASARDERAADAARAKAPDPFRILWQRFLPQKAVHLMSVQLDEVRGRLTNTIMMRPIFKHPMVYVEAPWKTKEGGASE